MEKRALRLTCALVAAFALSAFGCVAPSPAPVDIPVLPSTSTPPADAGSSGSVVTTAPTGSGASGTASPSTGTSKSSGVSAKSIAYATNLGGWDHKGQSFYFIVGGSFAAESEAQAALDKALPLFGDLQSYFIVQRSDNFAGMVSGPWVVVEAHFKTPSEENLEFARRGFPGSKVERARLTVSAPIPVFEDMVGGD